MCTGCSVTNLHIFVHFKPKQGVLKLILILTDYNQNVIASALIVVLVFTMLSCFVLFSATTSTKTRYAQKWNFT